MLLGGDVLLCDPCTGNAQAAPAFVRTAGDPDGHCLLSAATRAYIEQIRGVDSAYSVGALLNKHLIEECGRLNVPGRPILYRTTPDFLRTFGLESLDELPEIEKMQFGKQELPQQEETES